MTLDFILNKFRVEFKRYFLYYQESIILFIMSGSFTLIRYTLVSNLFLINNDGDSITTHSDMLIYFVLSLLITQVTFSELHRSVQGNYRKGVTLHIATKPVNKYLYYLPGCFADFVGNLIMKGFPLIFFAVFILKIEFSINQLIFIMIELLIIFILNSKIHYILGLITLDQFKGVIIENIYNIIYSLASGMLLPIYFYPEIIVKVFDYMPFKLLLYRPLIVLINEFNSETIIELLVLQFIWIPILMVAIFIIERIVGERIYING